MLLIQNRTLSPQSQKWLNAWQNKIDAESDYAAQIARANAMWGKGNTVTFKEIKKLLRDMCPGVGRCVYCEDSFADEIEHVFPKSIYPSKTFQWLNYIYACGPCNGPKNNYFSLIHPNGSIQDITPPKRKSEKYIPQRPNDTLVAGIINHRIEDPFYFLEIDIFTTFEYVAITENRTVVEIAKANYTRDVLQLNKRDGLVKARRNAYKAFGRLLREYVNEKQSPTSPTELGILLEEIENHNWQSVWYEMKRKREIDERTRDLFLQAPELL